MCAVDIHCNSCLTQVAALAAEGYLLFGTIETWLLWKLSKGGYTTVASSR